MLTLQNIPLHKSVQIMKTFWDEEVAREKSACAHCDARSHLLCKAFFTGITLTAL